MKSFIDALTKILSEIDNKTLDCYENDLDSIRAYIVSDFEANAKLKELITNHTIDFIKPIISNHLYFTKEAFSLKNPNIILKHIIWEMGTYHNMGLTFNFYKIFFENIISSIEKLENSLYDYILQFYYFLLDNFEYLIKNSITNKNPELESKNEIYENFFQALLNSNMKKAIDISNDFIKNKKDIKIFWQEIILPSMYNVGSKWANGEITVGQEHTATSICQKIMSLHYDKIFDSVENLRKKVLITISPNEFHEIGARMVSDFLEINNFDVYYFDSKSNIEDIISSVNEENIKDIIISTTLVSNLTSTKEFIKSLREKLDNIKIYVGGQAFQNELFDCKKILADYCILDIDNLLKKLNEE